MTFSPDFQHGICLTILSKAPIGSLLDETALLRLIQLKPWIMRDVIKEYNWEYNDNSTVAIVK